MSIHLGDQPDKAWSKKGEKFILPTKNKSMKGKRYSLCMSVDTSSNIYYILKEKSINKKYKTNNIKITIYLSEIKSNNDGPPVFIEGTHINNSNIKNDNIKIFCGGKGDALISYQSGLHKKMPQNNQSCGYLVFNFITN